ncbi:THAP domain-containing protein 5-like isoform X6 [Periplaneta americana]|uniref:THAP domain-containing protein 5-like isoform X6 n=1 Tax=Periplaneta americana TaxID=6978 RepID=UPI0037E7D653
MPKTCCCVPLCANRGGHVFPKDTAVRKKWLLNIKREKWTLSKTSVVCSNHFTPDDYISSTLRGGNKPLQRKLKRDAVPSVFPWNKRSTDADKERIFTRMRKKFYNVKNMDIVKVEPDEEEPVKGWLPPVKPEPQDPLDVNDERRESWGWNLNVIDSSSKHTQAKNEDLPWNAPEVKEELTIEDYELKLPGTKHVADNINTVTLKVEADEESVKIQLPPVKTEFQDPLDVTDEGVVPWKWNLNVTDSSFVHKQMKVENLPQKESLLNKETNEELTVDSRQTKPSKKNTMADNGRKKRSWSSEAMAEAIRAVRGKKMGWKKAVKTFQVPKTTLMRLSKEKYGNPAEASKAKLGRPTVLSTELEDELVKYCLATETTFSSLTHSHLKRLAFQLAEQSNIEHPFTKGNMAGKKWLDLFLRRHKNAFSYVDQLEHPLPEQLDSTGET